MFNDLDGDIKNTFEGENRVSNMVAYVTPNLNGLVATVAIVPGEGKDLDGDGKDDGSLASGRPCHHHNRGYVVSWIL